MNNFLQKLIILITIVATSCNSSSNQSVQNNETDTTFADTTQQQANNTVSQTICYTTKNNKDTVRLKVKRSSGNATGTLEYNLFEKDKNKGMYDGKLYGDTLIADYTFMSEGTKSIRQVAFLLTDSVATEGYADMEDKDGKLSFKNTSQLDFSKGTKLYKTECATE